MDGILIVDKPAGFTSHDVVAKTRRILRMKRVGHTGTLDPFATGVMVILLGRATRLAQFLDKDEKEYEAVARFGYETETGDVSGRMKDEGGRMKTEISAAEVENVLSDFRGEIWQTPPMYSAKKIEGKKLYELARKGIEIERKAVGVKIYELEVQSENYEAKSSDVSIRVVCSAGTYIRTLAEDIGRRLETGAHLAALRRTRAGRFDLSRAVTLEELETLAAENRISEILVSMNEAVSHLPEKKLSESEIAKIKNGMKLSAENESFAPGSMIRLTDENDELLAVGFYDQSQNSIQPKLVLL